MNEDFLELLSAFLAAEVRFLVIGANAVGVYAPRRTSTSGSKRARRFEQAWPNRQDAAFSADVRCPVIGLRDLLTNKRAAGRPQDLADVAALEAIDRARTQG